MGWPPDRTTRASVSMRGGDRQVRLPARRRSACVWGGAGSPGSGSRSAAPVLVSCAGWSRLDGACCIIGA